MKITTAAKVIFQLKNKSNLYPKRQTFKRKIKEGGGGGGRCG